jgi:hypothetical protein
MAARLRRLWQANLSSFRRGPTSNSSRPHLVGRRFATAPELTLSATEEGRRSLAVRYRVCFREGPLGRVLVVTIERKEAKAAKPVNLGEIETDIELFIRGETAIEQHHCSPLTASDLHDLAGKAE